MATKQLGIFKLRVSLNFVTHRVQRHSRVPGRAASAGEGAAGYGAACRTGHLAAGDSSNPGAVDVGGIESRSIARSDSAAVRPDVAVAARLFSWVGRGDGG